MLTVNCILQLSYPSPTFDIDTGQYIEAAPSGSASPTATSNRPKQKALKTPGFCCSDPRLEIRQELPGYPH